MKKIAADKRYRTDVKLHSMLEYLLTGAIRRQLWLIFLDDDHRIVGPFMPNTDLPRDPAEQVETDDLGRLTCAAVLAHRVRDIAELVGGSQAVLVWERPGRRRLKARDLAWARAMAQSCRDVGVYLRVQFLLHDQGLRAIAPDDLM